MNVSPSTKMSSSTAEELVSKMRATFLTPPNNLNSSSCCGTRAKAHCFHLPLQTAAPFKEEFRAGDVSFQARGGDSVLAAAMTAVVTSSVTHLHALLQRENTESSFHGLDLKTFLFCKRKGAT